MKKVICFGSCTKDVFLTLDDVRVIDNSADLTAQKLMAFEYGAKIYARELVEEVGGSAVNVAAGLTKGGYRTLVFSRASLGEIGKWIIKRISRLKIKKNYLQQTGVTESEVSVVILDKKTVEHVIIRTGDSVELFDVDKAINKFQEKVDWIFIGSLKRNWQKKLTAMLKLAEQKKALVAFNPSSYQISHDCQDLVRYFSQVQVLFVNRDEAIEIVQNANGTVKDDPKELLAKLFAFGPKIVAITDGENGAYVSDQKEIFYLPTQAKNKVDSLGAGDAFCSGFLSSYLENENLSQALCWGIANSGNVISQLGGTRGLLDRKQLKHQGEKLIDQVKNL